MTRTRTDDAVSGSEVIIYNPVSANGVSGLELTQHLLRVLRWRNNGMPFDIDTPVDAATEANDIKSHGKEVALMLPSGLIVLPNTASIGLIPSDQVEQIDKLLARAEAKHEDGVAWQLRHIVAIIQNPSFAKTA